MEKYDGGRQGVVDNIIQRMRLACWINKDTDTQYVIRSFTTATTVTGTRLSVTLQYSTVLFLFFTLKAWKATVGINHELPKIP